MINIEKGNYRDFLALLGDLVDEDARASIENENSTDCRRSFCTSTREAAGTLSHLMEIWKGWFPNIGFEDTFLKPMWEDEKTSGDDQIRQIKDVEEAKDFSPGERMTPGGRDAAMKIAILMVVCAYCVQALKAEKNSPLSWSYAIDAAKWLGIFQGFDSSGGHKKAVSTFGKLGADAVHAENRAMKAEVFTWLDTNMLNFKSMDAAAQAITKEQPIAFRTARDWTGEWKKVRSAGTP